MADWLLETALQAIQKANPDMASWLADKRHDYGDSDRLTVLRWICGSLDMGNRQIVSDALGINFNDLEATKRVLQKI